MPPERFVAVTLASQGYGGGDPDNIEAMPTETVLDLIDYVRFKALVTETSAELNKEARA